MKFLQSEMFPLEDFGFFLTVPKPTPKRRHPCNALCLEAKGNDCNCACMGKNHGRGFVVAENLFEGGAAPLFAADLIDQSLAAQPEYFGEKSK